MSQQTYHRVLVPLAEGFEEIEAITAIDVLRRADIHVTVATLERSTSERIKASRRTLHLAEEILDQLLESYFHAIVLPGGRPGTDNLRSHEGLRRLIQKHHSEGRLLAAICAAPLVLETAGVLTDKKFTINPAAKKDLRKLTPVEFPLVKYKNILTAQAAAHSMMFSLEIVRQLCGSEKMLAVAEGLMAPTPEATTLA